MKKWNMDQDLPPVERVLGVEWCIQSDTFKFKIVVKDRLTLTRRGILSTVSSIYDPLGILSCRLVCKEDFKGPVQESTGLG